LGRGFPDSLIQDVLEVGGSWAAFIAPNYPPGRLETGCLFGLPGIRIQLCVANAKVA